MLIFGVVWAWLTGIFVSIVAGLIAAFALVIIATMVAFLIRNRVPKGL